MLNKALLMAMGESWAPYTHIITVGGPWGPDENRYGLYQYNYGSNCIPNTLMDAAETPISQLWNEVDTRGITFTTGGYFLADATLLYLGRSDIRINYGHPDTGTETSGDVHWLNNILFTEKDLGKRVPIWLSYTPPHINFSLQFSSNGEGCVNAKQRIVAIRRSIRDNNHPQESPYSARRGCNTSQYFLQPGNNPIRSKLRLEPYCLYSSLWRAPHGDRSCFSVKCGYVDGRTRGGIRDIGGRRRRVLVRQDREGNDNYSYCKGLMLKPCNPQFKEVA